MNINSQSSIIHGVIVKPTGKRPLGMPSRRWENNISMDLKEIGIIMRNWVDSAVDRDYWRALVSAALDRKSVV